MIGGEGGGGPSEVRIFHFECLVKFAFVFLVYVALHSISFVCLFVKFSLV